MELTERGILFVLMRFQNVVDLFGKEGLAQQKKNYQFQWMSQLYPHSSSCLRLSH